MRAGDLIGELLKHVAAHDLAFLLFKHEVSDGLTAPLLIQCVESIEGTLAGQWEPVAVVWCDRGGGIENWDSELLPGGDERFMRDCLHEICLLRAQENHASLITRHPDDEADA